MKPDDAAKLHPELEALLREAQDEQAGIQRLINRVASFLTQATLEEFPGLKQTSAEGIRKFGDLVSRTSTTFALRASELAATAPG